MKKLTLLAAAMVLVSGSVLAQNKFTVEGLTQGYTAELTGDHIVTVFDNNHKNVASINTSSCTLDTLFQCPLTYDPSTRTLTFARP